MMLGDVEILVSEEVDELDPGKAWVTFGFSLGRASCLRPARLVTKYSHVRPRFAQRAHVGFSLLHLILEAAQTWQLSRSLGVEETVVRRAGAERVSPFGECTSAMMN